MGFDFGVCGIFDICGLPAGFGFGIWGMVILGRWVLGWCSGLGLECGALRCGLWGRGLRFGVWGLVRLGVVAK